MIESADVLIKPMFRAEFDNAGIDYVRDMLRSGKYHDTFKRKQAAAWLNEKDYAESTAMQYRQADAAERAANAAEVSANMAVKANRKATISAVIAFLSATVASWTTIKTYLLIFFQKIFG